MFENKEEKYGKVPIITIKIYYNTCIPLNLILKKDSTDIFSTLSSFDLDIICKGYCLQAKQYLDLTGDSVTTRIANINKWNPRYNSDNIWDLSRVFRQFSRVIKYEKRHFDTSAVAIRYKEILENIIEFENIFKSEKMEKFLGYEGSQRLNRRRNGR